MRADVGTTTRDRFERCQRSTSTGFLMQAFANGLPGNGDAAGVTTAFFGDADLHPAADGAFSITRGGILLPTRLAQDRCAW